MQYICVSFLAKSQLRERGDGGDCLGPFEIGRVYVRSLVQSWSHQPAHPAPWRSVGPGGGGGA